MLAVVDRRDPVRIPTGTLAFFFLTVATVTAVASLPLAAAPIPLSHVALCAAVAAVVNLWTLQMPGYGVVAIVDALYIGCLPALGATSTVIIGALAATVRVIRHRESIGVATWRVLQTVFAVALAGLVYERSAAVLPWAAATMAAALVLAAAQTTTSAVLRACREEVRFYCGMIRRRQFAVYLLVLAPLGLLLATLWRVAPLALLFLLLPVAMMYHSLKHYTEVLDEARATIEDMALAVERRDPNMVGHAARVAALAVATARELRVTEEDVDALATAGRLHDLGKISVPDRVLLKTDRLGQEEFEEVKSHTEVGGNVVAHCSLLQRQGDVASLIRQHHERFDGRGYPDGLAGNDILLGARILGLAEAWDTMTTPRTWRVVLTARQAVDVVLEGRGTQFDPLVVDAFLKVLKRKEVYR